MINFHPQSNLGHMIKRASSQEKSSDNSRLLTKLLGISGLLSTRLARKLELPKQLVLDFIQVFPTCMCQTVSILNSAKLSIRNLMRRYVMIIKMQKVQISVIFQNLVSM